MSKLIGYDKILDDDEVITHYLAGEEPWDLDLSSICAYSFHGDKCEMDRGVGQARRFVTAYGAIDHYRRQIFIREAP